MLLQLGSTSHPPEWPSLKSLQTTNAGEGVEKREHPPPLLVGMQTMNGLDVPYKI